MPRYFKASDRDHWPNGFRVLILISDSLLVSSHLEQYAPEDYNMEERISRDRYILADFHKKHYFDCRYWQEIKVNEYQLYHTRWHQLHPILLKSKTLKVL